MKVVIIGADGQLGSDLCKVIPQKEQISLTIKDVDITTPDQVLAVLKKYSPEIVINTAAYNDVNGAEHDADTAFAVNRDGVKNIAEVCKIIDATLVHISTDYVFDGKKGSPYVESDPPKPLSVYADSKLQGEIVVKEKLEKYYIVRSSGLYGTAGCMGKKGTNFVEQIYAKKDAMVIADEVLSPTYTLDLANKIYALIKTNKFGAYHIVNIGQCSWFQFARQIFKLIGRDQALISTKKSGPTLAERPKYSVLKNSEFAKDMRSWQDALKAYLIEKGYLPAGSQV